ncbi:metabotropic glutamate receptor [Apostichopus japonicus]|uniref:Metabotropic glutamate receptor n=1 Tax=Stichopus japonicus TaxID=307972 RepID=A0A2G8LNR5_STIJA|nr:metabotropic glutamate receptor [Apostichopus japonicus]
MKSYDSNIDVSSIQDDLNARKSNVAILVMSLSTAEDLLTRMEIDRHVTFIIIDPYGPSPSVMLPSQLNGALIVSTRRSLDDFDDYITSLGAGENSDNPWFDELITTKYGCVLTGQNSQRCGMSDRIQNSLASINAQNIIDSVYALARGIDSVKSEMCGIGSEGFCKAFFQVNPARVKDIMADQEFESEGGRMVTMRKGSAVEGFDIWNSNVNGEVSQVGSWEDGTLTIKNVYLEDTRSVLEGKWLLFVVFLSAAGIIISVMFIFGVLIQRQSPQAQVYSIFLTTVLLIFIICTFAQNALFYLTPSPLVCGVRRSAYSAVLTSAFLAVFLMTVRIYRILAREKRITGPRTLYINNKSQARLFLWLSVITIIMVLQQWLLQRPAVVSDCDNGDNAAYCQFMDGHYAISLLFLFVLMLATVFVSILAMCRSSTILSKEIWLGFICVICK